MSKTRIFISSTCYDLSQIRKDLKEGIEAMGHEAVLSENKDFPINPSLTSAENCIEAVRNDIDVFVLIIGNKYGYKLESGKSITNSEFLTAVEIGIPVYTFSLKQMVDILPFWKKNKDADCSDLVDDNKVFEFLEDVREKRSIWNFEFESAQDILEILKSQLSIMFKHSLGRCRIVEKIDDSLIDAISGKALKILVDKPELYEIRFFLQLIQDEINKYRNLKRDCEYAIVLKTGPYLDGILEISDWQLKMIHQLEKIMDSLNRLMKAFENYYGELGVESDVDGLYYVALGFGEHYAHLLNWVLDVLSVSADEEFDTLLCLLSKLPLKAMEQFEAFPNHAMDQIDSSYRHLKEGTIERGTTISLTLTLGIDDDVQNKLNAEIDRLKAKYSHRPFPLI